MAIKTKSLIASAMLLASNVAFAQDNTPQAQQNPAAECPSQYGFLSDSVVVPTRSTETVMVVKAYTDPTTGKVSHVVEKGTTTSRTNCQYIRLENR